MGYMVHHAILVTTQSDPDLLRKAHRDAQAFGNNVTPITSGVVNGTLTFAVVPDGSKDGWGVSDEGDDARDDFVRWLKQQAFADGSSALDWCEVQYGDEDGNDRLLRSNHVPGTSSRHVP